MGDLTFPGTPALNGYPGHWHVFPLEPEGKRPVTEHGVKDAAPANDWGSKYGWPGSNCNVGLACGKPSGVYVIDLDGPQGLGHWDALEIRHGETPTRLALTGSGGLHRFFSIPEQLGGLPNTAKKIGPGIDTRGNGGYVVLPPSIHPNGVAYRWLNDLPLAPLPQWVVSAVRTEGPAQRGAYQARRYVAQTDDKLAVRILGEECDKVRSAPEGQRNHTLFAACASMAELVAGGEISADTVAHRMGAAAQAAGLGRREIDQTVGSAFKAGMASPRIIRTRSQA